MNWWDDERYDYAPMNYSRRDSGPMKRIALTTDPVMERTTAGALRLRLVNRHPHEAVRVFRGSRKAL